MRTPPDTCGQCKLPNGPQIGNTSQGRAPSHTQIMFYARDEDVDPPRDLFVCIECGHLQYEDGTRHHVALATRHTYP